MAAETIDIAIYESPGGNVEVRLERETVWLTQRQMADLFDSSMDNVGLHIKNIYKNQELTEKSTTEDYSVVRQEGKRRIQRTLKHYNLDVIISVGYRVNTRRGVQFRQWATRLLVEHLTRGYTLNRQRFEENARELEAALALIRKASGSNALTTDQGRGLVDVIARYTQTFLLLQRYDDGLLTEPKGAAGGVLPAIAEARARIAALRQDLMTRGEAGDLFGREREAGLESILGNLEQSVFGEPAYPSVEAKAAHLLYFVIKNHPFSDGNKRIGSFLFVEFLHRNDRLFRGGISIVSDMALAALALLVAESDPKQKDMLIRLIMHMLAGAE